MDLLYENAKAAIERMYADKSISKEECASKLRELIEEMEIWIEALGV